jgi:hypothetical protein
MKRNEKKTASDQIAFLQMDKAIFKERINLVVLCKKP